MMCAPYVYPDHWPQPPKKLNPSKVRAATTEGFRTWCLLVTLLVERARKLQHLIETAYMPLLIVWPRLGLAGLLNVRCVDCQGIAENAGRWICACSMPARRHLGHGGLRAAIPVASRARGVGARGQRWPAHYCDLLRGSVAPRNRD